tara:strand:+ start:48329 stop:48922 length:594 start_codon:yes stop_codon:yes gene_type:complete
MFNRKTIVLLILSLISSIAIAQEPKQELGPMIGAKIPHDLTMMTTNGKIENYKNLSGENGLAIFFVRSFDWCPYCQTQAKDVNARAADFQSRDINPVFISYDTPDIQKNFYDRWQFVVPILSDPQSEVIKAFDILNTDGVSEDSPIFGFPHPIVFIVGTDGTIRDKLYIESETQINGSSYKERPPIDDILAAIDELK